jgi:hypothetical protein
VKVFWFFFSKKNALSLARGRPANPARQRSSARGRPASKRFFLKKEAKTFVHYQTRPQVLYRSPSTMS